MTATCTVEMLSQLQMSTGLFFTKDKRNMFWPNSFEIRKINVFTHVMYTTRALRVFTTDIDPSLLVSKVSLLFSMPISGRRLIGLLKSTVSSSISPSTSQISSS